MKTANDWVQEIEELWDGQKRGEIPGKEARERNNTLGKFIQLRKLHLSVIRAAQQSPDLVAELQIMDKEKVKKNGK